MDKTIRAKKSLGQNFLKDPNYLKKIVGAAQLGPEDLVLEIGPGLGHLTHLLASRAKKVLALEIDERLIPLLRQEFSMLHNVEIVHEDAIDYPYETLSGRWKVIANLPYYIATPIIQKLVTCRDKFTTLTLMLQQEVAERVAALPGGRDYGYLSVLVQLYAEPNIEFRVPPGAFTPKPEVTSAVITLKIRNHPVVEVLDESFFVRVVKAAFSQRRKTLKNSLKQLDVPLEKLATVLNRTGIDLKRRAETLTIREFGLLSDHLSSSFSR